MCINARLGITEHSHGNSKPRWRATVFLIGKVPMCLCIICILPVAFERSGLDFELGLGFGPAFSIRVSKTCWSATVVLILHWLFDYCVPKILKTQDIRTSSIQYDVCIAITISEAITLFLYSRYYNWQSTLCGPSASSELIVVWSWGIQQWLCNFVWLTLITNCLPLGYNSACKQKIVCINLILFFIKLL